MANTNVYEDGLKMIEVLTTNAEQIQEQVLEEILKKNAATEYLSRFLLGQTDKKTFKQSVPIVTYQDIKPYIDRIANGEPSDILLADPVIEFHYSGGTSGGQQKLIPATAELQKKRAIYYSLIGSAMRKHFYHLNQARKVMSLMFIIPEIETPSGIKARNFTTSLFKNIASTKNLSTSYTSPTETVLCSETTQSLYCQLLAGLIQRDEVVMFGSTFAATVLRAMKFLEDHWEELCSNIRKGEISDWITDSGCRNALSLIMKPNPELADSIEDVCSCKSWDGIIKRLWPRAKFVQAIITGSMSQYVETLNFYSGGLPLLSLQYACSEAACGINLEPPCKPSDVSYTFVPNMAYFEFLPVKNGSITRSQDQVQFNGVSDHHESIEMKRNNQDIEPVDLSNVKLGQHYELLVTTCAGLYRYKVEDILKVSGFHNNTPQFQFVERKNVLLSVDGDKTTEDELLKAVTEAKTLLDPLGFILREYTSYVDTSSTPGHYVLFWELKAVKEGNKNIKYLDPQIMVECCSRMEESLSYVYRLLRKENAIAALEIRVVKQGTFDALMDYYESKGASISQYKTPSCIKSKDALKILDFGVIGMFFSPKCPNLLSCMFSYM